MYSCIHILQSLRRATMTYPPPRTYVCENIDFRVLESFQSIIVCTIPSFLQSTNAPNHSSKLLTRYGPKVSMVPKYGPKVGTARHSWYFGTIGTLEHWNGWNIVLWNIGTVGTLVRLGPYLGIIFVNIISLSTSFLCQ